MDVALPQWTVLDLMGAVGKSSVVLLALLLVLVLFRRQSAARRVLAAQLSLLALVAWPVVWSLFPAAQWQIQVPLAWSAWTDAPLVLPDVPGLAVLATPPEGEAWQVTVPRLLFCVYASVAGLLLLYWGVATLRLAGLKREHQHQNQVPVSTAGHQLWLSRLAQLRSQLGVRRPVQLLVSDRIRSPISWGVFRPVIGVDTVTLEHIAPDAVLRHELAHIARFDWLWLMLARVVVALYWFHPLAWLILQQLQFNMECATDDAVLAHGGVASHYAETLVTISQLAHSPAPAGTPLAANGNTLVTRVLGILEPHRQRQPVSRLAWAVCAISTLLISVPMGSAALVGEQTRWAATLFAQTESLASNAGSRAADALDQLGNPNYTALARALRLGDYAQRHALGSESFKQRAAIAPLVLALHDTKASTRRLALWGLGEMRFAETGPVMAALLTDPEPLVRAEAARALAELSSHTWTSHISPLLQDPEPVVRANAAHALGDLADPRSLVALQKALPDSNDKVTSEVKWAIREVQGGEDAP